MLTANSVVKELKKLGSPKKAKASAWFFKTGEGHYGHGDVFFGVTVPEQRKIAKKYADLPDFPIGEIGKLLKSKVHECRLTALLILVMRYKAADKKTKERIAKFYLSNAKRVNNWDLVDSSAPYIPGPYLLDKNSKNRRVLYKLAKSENLWERRIAVLATYAFIQKGEYADTLKIAEVLLKDKHDLIHKATGWMLREAGKMSLPTEEKFLKKYAAAMPRTMLRYAIEKFPEKKRKFYLGMRLKI